MGKKGGSKSVPKAPSKKAKRCSSMERTVQDAQDFLKTKRITKNRTMRQTINDSKNVTKPTKPKKQTKRLVRKAVKSKPAVPAKPAPSIKPTLSMKAQPSRSIDKPKKSESVVKKTNSKQSIKATVFKTKSKDKLPLPAFGYIDVCFCVDATGSMSSELAQVKSTIVAIINKIQTKVATEGIVLRFAVVTYRDHPPQQTSYVTKIMDFTNDHQIIDYVNKLTAEGGGDQPEAVHDGLLDSVEKLNWVEIPGTAILRYIFHVADAPPHGKEFVPTQSQQGCLCGKKTEDIVKAINRKQIHYRLIKVRNNPRVDEMEKLFKKQIVDFDSVGISNAKEMDVRVSDMIIHEILPDFA